ncbi:MAG: LPS assembly lipoprotein LptE [Cellvibrionaceae bacterium]|nr:LPS assembly lipoprotein LptE [Cellvibrionaceae bacterium]MCV6626173.1 LPS assembly lipoprotein LptE [Cellvibrionaceae bacterium]
MAKLSKLLLITLLALLSACGWQLRGQETLGLNIGKLYVSSSDTELLNDLKAALKRSGVELSPGMSEADYHLLLAPNRFERRTAAVGSQILAAEYELTMQLRYQIAQNADKPYLDKAKAHTIRSYAYDPNNTLGKAQEERILRREMRADLIAQIMRRLALIKPSQAN